MLRARSVGVECRRYFLAGSVPESNHLWMNSNLQAKNIAGEKERAYRRNN
jgi:hypothetical protein